MFAISPVLAGTFDAPDYFPTASNINAATTTSAAPSDATNAAAGSAASASSVSNVNATSDTKDVDPRRYTKWDRSASQVADAPNFSFSDFLDTINPLQHIPVVSAVYRGITGEKINPVARVAGDILFGGALGALSAVAGGVGAIGDALSESQGSKGVAGTVVASIFGGDSDKTTQIASAKTANPSDPSSVMTIAGTIPVQQAALASLPASSAATTNTTLASAAPNNGIPLPQAKSIPLDRSKLAYGGVMDTSKNIESQNMAIALSESSHAMRLGHTIYTSPLMNGEHPLPVASSANTPTSAAPNAGTGASVAAAANAAPSVAAAGAANTSINTGAAAPTVLSAASSSAAANNAAPLQAATDPSSFGPHKNPIPQNLVDDLVMMKALNQYKGVATGPASLGSTLDVTN